MPMLECSLSEVLLQFQSGQTKLIIMYCVWGGGDVTCGHKDRVLPIWCRFFPYSNNMENDSVLSTT